MTIEAKIKRAQQLRSEISERETELANLEAQIAAEQPDAVRDYLQRHNEGAAKLFNPLVQ